MHPNLKPVGSARRSRNLAIACAYLLGLLALPITIALCGELWLGSRSKVSLSAPEQSLLEQFRLEQSPEVEHALT